MIEERYVSFEIAKLLKEKGFNEPCRLFYKDPQAWLFEFINAPKAYKDNPNNPCFLAPTPYMVMDWLRQVHGIHIYIELGVREDKPNKYVTYYKPVVEGMFNTKHLQDINEKAQQHFAWKFYDDYAKAVDDAIVFTLKNLI